MSAAVAAKLVKELAGRIAQGGDDTGLPPASRR